ncbi:uncharacterized protein LOC131850877 [Achroia grisella]|uniref:uncharacterized protein LOC131850877 n=1 Tax=Achroia grisella TaxID=688607 RepID=UPI0027D1F2FB|nr:uncharacterized protein LOC131850877 [Achroia grisella]
MKFLIVSCAFVAVLAEPPRFRPARFRFQRQELAPTTTESPTEATTEAEGPYPPSGWKPAGEPFPLPKQTELQPTYGPPQGGPYPPSGWKPAGQAFTLPNEQQPPATSYGVPDNTYGAPSTDAPTTDNPESERLDSPVEVQKSVGSYYVLLPSGQLQKVEFMTENDIQNMKYTARLQLRAPAPLLVFGP